MSRAKTKTTRRPAAKEAQADNGPTPPKTLAKMGDPAKAFDAVDGMEESLTGIEHLTAALHLITSGMNQEDILTVRALMAVAYGIDHHVKEAWEKRSVGWKRTWAFRFGGVS